jgi:hypothetical protein
MMGSGLVALPDDPESGVIVGCRDKKRGWAQLMSQVLDLED